MSEKTKRTLKDQSAREEENKPKKVKKYWEERKLNEKEDTAGASAAASDTVYWHQKFMNLMKDVETELQCPICNEVFIEATTTNCGHTFCHFCIHKWMKHGHENCPTCRTKITQKVAVKTLDNYTDKIYEQCESEARRAARTSLKQERLMLRSEIEAEAAARRERNLVLIEQRFAQSLERSWRQYYTNNSDEIMTNI